MLQSIRRRIARHLVNYRGWHTNKKIVVIESDDWGSIRMPSQQVYEAFLKKGVPVDQSPYCRYDSLAGEEDLEALFETLLKFKDRNGNSPVITANTIVANPDFEQIRSSGFTEYAYEPFTETLKRYPGRKKSFRLWQQGMEAGIFRPQFHGREHLNVPLWLHNLQYANSFYREAFESQFWGLDLNGEETEHRSIQAAFDAARKEELKGHESVISDGVRLFREIFGFLPDSFIAPNYIWDPSLHEVLRQTGVKYIQGMKYQKLPIYRSNRRKMVRHYAGERSQSGQAFLIRNSVFEPSLKAANYDVVGSCLKDIANAFFWKKPAVITSHRINYIGYLKEENRSENLKKIQELIRKIQNLWPEAEFLSSDQLGEQLYGQSA